MKLVVVFCAIIVAAASIKLPPNFKKCNRKQPDFNTCLLEAARFAVPQLDRPYKELKMISLNPLEIPKLIATIDVPSSNITCILSNCKFYGLNETQIENFEIDFEKKHIDLVATFPWLKSECQYEIDGQIVLARVKGQGSSSMTLGNFKWNFNLKYEEVKRRGKTYVKAISSSFDGKPESFSMNMDDLFGGDRELGERANRIINDNWSDIYDDVKIYYLDYAKNTWLEIMSGWFARLSLEEAFDD